MEGINAIFKTEEKALIELDEEYKYILIQSYQGRLSVQKV